MNYKPTVLIADGSDACMSLSIVLNRMNFMVVPVQTGPEALELARAIRPDVVLLDINLPEKNGITVLKNIKENEITSDISVIMMSIKTNDEIRAECENLMCDGFLIKPLNVVKLHKELQKCIQFPDGRKRRYIRAACNSRVHLEHKGVVSEYSAIILSEGGMYIRGDRRLPVGEDVSVTLSLHDNRAMSCEGSVLYTRSAGKQFFDMGPGMAIGFKGVSVRDSDLLRGYVSGLLTQGISGVTKYVRYM